MTVAMIVHLGASYADRLKTLILQLHVWGVTEATESLMAADTAVCATRLAEHKPHVECQRCLACECHTKLPNMHAVPVSLPPTQKLAACKRNNASMADGPQMHT